MKKKKNSKKTAKIVAFMGVFIALSMILSFLESKLPSPMIPGIKIGLPNLVIVFLLYRFKWWQTLTVSFVRVLLTAMLFGNAQSFLFSIAGAALSIAGMMILKRIKGLSPIVVSITGGILHNVGQIIAACIMTQTKEMVLYLPVLLISGILSGAVIGLVSGWLVKRLEKVKI